MPFPTLNILLKYETRDWHNAKTTKSLCLFDDGHCLGTPSTQEQQLNTTNQTSRLLSHWVTAVYVPTNTTCIEVAVQFDKSQSYYAPKRMVRMSNLAAYLTLGEMLPQDVVTELIQNDSLRHVTYIMGHFEDNAKICSTGSQPGRNQHIDQEDKVSEPEALWCLDRNPRSPLTNVHGAVCFTGTFYLNHVKTDCKKSDELVHKLFAATDGLETMAVGGPLNLIDVTRGEDFNFDDTRTKTVIRRIVDLRLGSDAEHSLYNHYKAMFQSRCGTLAVRRREGLERDFSSHIQQEAGTSALGKRTQERGPVDVNNTNISGPSELDKVVLVEVESELTRFSMRPG